ncbi:MAG: hypothetical protein NZ749_14560, partial [bacterium]|nr:hypothetical protein [bacterium]
MSTRARYRTSLPRLGFLLTPSLLALLAGAYVLTLLGCSSGGMVPVPVPRERCDPATLPRINAP